MRELCYYLLGQQVPLSWVEEQGSLGAQASWVQLLKKHFQ